MKHIHISFLKYAHKEFSLPELSELLNGMEIHSINDVPWKEKNMQTPEVRFSIAYDTHHIFLKYYVKENQIRAVYQQPNDPVYKDSCVEFFIAFNDGSGYYNLEFNCKGTCLMGFGPDRKQRTLLPEFLIKQITSLSVISSKDESDKLGINWELTINIPLEVFHFHNIKTLKGEKCLANFYKCGDDLQEPHYLVWNNVETEIPNFHVPEFFGKLSFV
jgi:hypothetical protein